MATEGGYVTQSAVRVLMRVDRELGFKDATIHDAALCARQPRPDALGVVNVDGYELSYSDASVITHYAVLTSGAGFEAIEREFNAIRKHDRTSLNRPAKLRGLSPWADAGAGPPNGASSATVAARQPWRRLRRAPKLPGSASSGRGRSSRTSAC